MSTFHLSADFRELDNDPNSTTMWVTIRATAQIVGTGPDVGAIYDGTTKVAVVDGILDVDLPANDSDPEEFGYIISRTGGFTRRWQVPAQDPNTEVNLSEFTSTTPLPVTPSGPGGAVDSVVGQTGVVTAQQIYAAIQSLLPDSSGGGTDLRLTPLIVFIGESNSGGLASNSSLTTEEAAPRPAVQIFDNHFDQTGVAQFQDLDIGTNNNVNHVLLDVTTHGWENGLANSVEAGEWAVDTVYLVKTGQGGSKVAEWATDGTYWPLFVNRVKAAMELMLNAGLIPDVYIWCSQGINDVNAGTNMSTWFTAEQEWWGRVRGVLGDAPIFTTRFMAGEGYEECNLKIDALAQADNMVFVIQSETPVDAPDVSGHWNYAGMKILADRFVKASLGFGQGLSYKHMRDFLRDSQAFFDPGSVSTSNPTVPTISIAPAITGSTSMGSTLTCSHGTWSGGGSITYTYQWKRGGTPISGQTAATHVVVSGDANQNLTCTVTATNLAGSGSATTAAVSIGSAPDPSGEPVVWTSITNGTDSGNGVITSGAGQGGALGSIPIVATSPFDLIATLASGAADTVAIVLDDPGDPAYDFGAQTFIAGFYAFSGSLYAATNGSGTVFNKSISAPYKVRLRKSGNDILLSTSTDGGATWSATEYTFAGVLSGKTNLIIKAMFTNPGGNAQAIKVQYVV